MSTEWQRSIVTLAWTVIIGMLMFTLHWAAAVCIPIAMAIFAAFILTPVVNRLQRRGLGRTPAVILATLGVFLLVGGSGVIVGLQLSSLANTLPDHQEVIVQKVAAAKNQFTGDGNSRLGHLFDEVYGLIVSTDVKHKPEVVLERSSSMDWVSPYLNSAGEFAAQAALAMVLTVFMLLKKEDLRNRMIRLLGDGKVTVTTRAVDDASTRISRYLFIQLIINTAFGVIITLGLFALGVQYAVLWGFIASLMRYVPYLGTLLGMVPPVLFSFATAPEWGGGWGQPVLVLVLFVTLEFVGNNVIEPWLYGKSMGVSEVAQLIAAGFWTLLWGPIGLILSGPITVCLLVLGRHVRRFEFLEVLLGDRPALSPPIAFYQRLTARDQDEAAEIALKISKESGTHVCIDEVLVPAMCIARRDLDDGDLDTNDFRYSVRAAREIFSEINEQNKFPEHRNGARVRVLVVATRDEAEHVVADAFASTLDPHRWEVKVAGDEILASEFLDLVDEFEPAAVVLATLPPGGISHCRYLTSRLRGKFPNIKVLIGRWGCEDMTLDSERIGECNGMDRTLTATRERLEGIHAVLEKAESDTRLAHQMQ